MTQITPHRIAQLAKEAGFVQGPWANSNKDRIWQENRDFPDALEVFASLIAKECTEIIKQQISDQSSKGILSNTLGLNQAIFSINDHFGLDNQADKERN
jgi:hypothetical protein